VSTPAPDQQLSGGAYLRLVATGAAIGIPAALVAALFLGLVHYIEHWLWHDLPDGLGYDSPPWFLVIALPLLGAGIVLVARLFLPGDGGHPPMEGLSMHPTPVPDATGVAIAALGTLCFGAVLGPEMPVVALGSVVGVAVTLVVRVGPRETAVLSTAGSFSAISALFGGPIVAGMLLVEGGLAMGTALLPVLIPGFVAAAVGYLIFIGFGDWGGLEAPGLVVPNLPLYEGTHGYDLLVGIVVGILAAVVVVGVRRLATRVVGVGDRRGMPYLLLAGGLAVGLIAWAADALGADSQDVLFSGQASIPVLVSDDTTTKVLVILIVAKFLAYAVSLGCGFRGGAIFPALFLGIALASLTVVWFDVSPTLAVGVGAAAGMAAQAKLLISSMIFAGLLIGTQNSDAAPAVVLAASAAWIAVTALERRANVPGPSRQVMA
jgi:H+/Cl- antiporter ClcA